MQILPAAERQRDLPVDEAGLFDQELRFGVSPAVAQSVTLPKHRKSVRTILRSMRKWSGFMRARQRKEGLRGSHFGSEISPHHEIAISDALAFRT
jgi:hypothetical protein